MLDTTIAAYKKLDALFANQAADIQMDIDTMNTMLAREGRSAARGAHLDIKGFHEAVRTAAERDRGRARSRIRYKLRTNDEKGSTSHG